MTDTLRKTGIDVIGGAGWGTHFCLFYDSPRDLVEILVPYFKAGLESNEFCMWITSAPLGADEARAALAEALPDLDRYIAAGQIEILDYRQWYLIDAKFDAQAVLQGWIDKERDALARGFAGLRLTGNTFWLEEGMWQAFTDYEALIEGAIHKHRMIALCTYCAARCNANEVMDVLSNHEFALVRRQGRWDAVGSSARRRAEEALQRALAELENTIQERTAELSRANTALREEIGERQRAEQELRSTSLYARSLIEASLDPLVTISPEGKITDVNRATELATGEPRERLIGADFSDYFTEPERARIGYQRVLSHGFVRDYPLTMRHTSGHTTDVLYHASLYRNQDGTVAGVFAAARDITERRRAESQLRSASLYARSLIEASLDPLVTISPEGKITDVNRATELVTGEPRERLIGADFSDYFTEPERAREGYQRVLSHGLVRDYPLTIRHTSGRTTDVLYHATMYLDENGRQRGVFAAARDITERKRAEEERTKLIREQAARVEAESARARFAFLAEASRLLGSSLDFRGTLSALARLIVPKLADWCTIDLVEDDGSINCLEISHVDPDKVRWGWKLRQAYPLDMDAEIGVPAVIRTGKSQLLPDISEEMLHAAAKNSQELELLRSVGYRSIMVVPLQVRGRNLGAITLVAAESGRRFSADDLTLAENLASRAGAAIDNAQLYGSAQRDLAERRRAEEALQQRTAQLEAANAELEAFTYSASHDLRAPLRAIDGFSRILEQEHADHMCPEAVRYVRLVRSNTQQMGRLIDGLLSLSRLGRQPLKKQAVQPASIVQQCLDELADACEGRQVRIEVAELPACEGDPTLLKQVWFNLLANALKFTRGRDVATIEVGACRVEEEAGRQGVAYFVRDNGVGFDMAYAHKLFRVFERLHRAEDYEGTGIGLATVQRIISRHGGRVWTEACEDKGACFYFSLGGCYGSSE